MMNFGYAQPFSFKIERSEASKTPKPKSLVESIHDGVTEIALTDGKVIRATLRVKSVELNPDKPDTFDIAYNIVAEVMPAPTSMIFDAHETLQ